MSSLTTVEFRGDTLFAVERDDGVFVAIKPISERLGLAWNKQLERLKRDPLLAEGMTMTVIPSPSGAQETTCLALRCVNGWLFGIDSSRVKPELRERVLAYQRECYDVLADHFLGPRAAAAPIRMPEAGQDTEYRRRLDTVSEARRLYGSARARLLYERLGLPEVPELPAGTHPAADPGTPEPVDAGALVADVRAFLSDNRGGLVPTSDAGQARTWARRGVVGFIAPNGRIYLHDEGWRGAIGGRDPAAAADALHAAGLLVRGERGRSRCNVRLGGRTLRAYCLRPEILAD